MSRTTSILFAAAASLALLLPGAARAEYFIPDGNSAVNQYTEGFPTGGGEKSAKGAGDQPVRPAQTLGAGNTEKLEQEAGREGREAAEVAAETAPVAPVASEEPAPEPAGSRQSDAEPRPDRKQNLGGAKGGGEREPADEETGATATIYYDDGPSGSGGLGEVLGAATGGAGGGIGLLLPLALLAALAWGIGYAWRERHSDSTATTRP